MKTLALSLFLATIGGAAIAETPAVIAVWSENSGSLPPEYAWEYRVEMLTGGTVQATYCKGYATEGPGCATVKRKFSAAAQKAMEDAIEPLAQDLLDNPPQQAGDDEIPIGGGSTSGRLMLGETPVILYAFPRAADVSRVQEVLKILQASTPTGLVEKAKKRAKQP